MADRTRLVGMVGLYDDTDSLLMAARAVRDAGYRRWDCHTPFPVHGLDQAMGLKSSPIPYICIGSGFVGAGLAMLMQWWMSAVDYPVWIGGKPLFSWPAFVPITFELFVLFAALGTMGGVLFFCRLLRWHSPLHDSGVMPEITSNRFGIVLDVADAKFREDDARELLAGTGCTDIRPPQEDLDEEEER